MSRSKLPYLVLTLAIAGCTGHGLATAPKASRAATATAAPPEQVLLPLPAAGRRLIAIGTPASLTGTVGLNVVNEPYFADSAASYGLLGVAAGHALLNVGTLESDLYTHAGQVVTGATLPNGTFALTDAVPGDVPFVLQAHLAGDHTLSAIVPAGAVSASVDEASSMVTELARWQLLPFADANHPDLADLSASDLQTLHDATAAVLQASDLPVTAGTTPSVEALKTGAGHLLRNAYVAAFGGRVTATSAQSSPPEANVLSDTWESLLGYKPLALTVAAGSGVHTSSQEEGKAASDVDFLMPRDAVEDAHGHMVVADYQNGTIQIVPRTDIPGPYFEAQGDSGTLKAGHAYTIAGLTNSTQDPTAYNALFADAGANDPTGAPAVAPPDGFPLFTPQRLLLEPGADNVHDSILYSSPLDFRVFMLACEDTTRFGIAMKAGHLYAVAGSGANYGVLQSNAPSTPLPTGDGGPAVNANLGSPTAIARDAAGNLFLLDTGPSGRGEIRVVRASDDAIFTLATSMNGQPLPLTQAGDMRLSPDGNWLYVAETDQHFVFKIPAPTAGAIAAMVSSPGPSEVTRVLGNPGKPGFMDTSITGVQFPDVHRVADPVAESAGAQVHVLLNAPTALAFDPAGDLMVADANRLRMLRSGQVYTLAGGFDTNFVTGDARLCVMPDTASLAWSPFDHNLLLCDRALARVRRLWTARGIIHVNN